MLDAPLPRPRRPTSTAEAAAPPARAAARRRPAPDRARLQPAPHAARARRCSSTATRLGMGDDLALPGRDAAAAADAVVDRRNGGFSTRGQGLVRARCPTAVRLPRRERGRRGADRRSLLHTVRRLAAHAARLPGVRARQLAHPPDRLAGGARPPLQLEGRHRDRRAQPVRQRSSAASSTCATSRAGGCDDLLGGEEQAIGDGRLERRPCRRTATDGTASSASGFG